MLSSSSTKKIKQTSKTDKDVLPEYSSLTKDKHSRIDHTLSDVEKEYSNGTSITEDTILVIIQNLDGTFFTLNVTSSDSVTKVKEMIKAKKEIDAYKYYLVCNGTELEDEKTVSDYGIQHESFIRMLPFISNNVQFPVLNNYGKTHWIKINVNEPIKNLQTKIQNECEIPLDKQCFTCFGMDERTLSHGSCGMEEISNGIKEVRDDIAEIKCDLENEFGGTNDVNVQDNNFDGHYQEDEDETPADPDSENAASKSVEEYDSSHTDKDLIVENKESDSNKSSTEDDENDVIIPFHESNEPQFNQATIITANEYQIVYKYFGKRLLNYLYVFDPVNRNAYYEYRYHKSSSAYVCNRCLSVNMRNKERGIRVLAKEIGNDSISLPQHCCQKKESKIVKKPYFERVKEDGIEHIHVFTSEDKTNYYDFTWFFTGRKVCKKLCCTPCLKNHKYYVTADLIFLNDEKGEECLQLKIRQHLCVPINVQN